MTATTGASASAIATDGLLLWVLVASGVLLALALTVLTATLVLRLLSERRARHRRRVQARWRPILFDLALSDAGNRSELPALAYSDLSYFMELWLTLFQTLRGEPRARMVQVAEQLDLHPWLRAWLDQFNIRRQLVAMISLGYLRDRAAWPVLAHYLDDRRTVFSLSAARALVATDPSAAAPEIIARMGRSDWSLDRVVSLLAEVPEAERATLIGSALAGSDETETVRLLDLLDRLHQGGQDDAIAQALVRFPHSDDVLAAALSDMHTRRWLPEVRARVEHTNWVVRMRVAQALGRLGNAEDLSHLRRLLDDPVWWVRQRAAQSLVSLPGAGPEGCIQLLRELGPGYAYDALNEALGQQREAS